MRRVRFTFQGAYHHVMNRGIRGETIFFDDKAKEYFIRSIKELSQIYKIRILAYCILNNHYHLILVNSSGKLSDFMKLLNGNYGLYYRKRVGGKGYVFQNRFKSTLIDKDSYLNVAISYVLLNPVRKGLVAKCEEYKWSSMREYFSRSGDSFVDRAFVEDIFGSEAELNRMLDEWQFSDLPLRTTRMGDVLGEEKFVEMAKEKFDRRKKKLDSKKRRKYEYELRPANEVIKYFEKEYKVKLEEIVTKGKEGKRLRDALLVLLKDRVGLKYAEIIRFPVFKGLKYSSLGKLYKLAKNRN